MSIVEHCWANGTNSIREVSLHTACWNVNSYTCTSSQTLHYVGQRDLIICTLATRGRRWCCNHTSVTRDSFKRYRQTHNIKTWIPLLINVDKWIFYQNMTSYVDVNYVTVGPGLKWRHLLTAFLYPAIIWNLITEDFWRQHWTIWKNAASATFFCPFPCTRPDVMWFPMSPVLLNNQTNSLCLFTFRNSVTVRKKASVLEQKTRDDIITVTGADVSQPEKFKQTDSGQRVSWTKSNVDFKLFC